MNNLNEQLQHRIIEPRYYHRRFENDFPQEENSWQDAGKRCALIALPFLSLHKPFGTVISLSMGTVRSFTCFSSAWHAADAWECSSALFQTTLAVLTVTASYFSFTSGLLLTTGIDTLTSSAAFAKHLANGELDKAFEEFIQTGIGTLYCISMLSGQLEIVFAISLAQGLLSLYQSHREFTAERYPEAIAKVIMGMLRLHQAQSTFEMIKRRDFLLSVESYRRLNERVLMGREGISHISESSLKDLSLVVKDNEVFLTDAKGNAHSFGSNFHGHGKGLVKGANLIFRQVTVDGKNKIELDFKVNHVFRQRIQQAIDEMKGMDATGRREMLEISHSHATDIHFQQKEFPVGTRGIGPATEVTLDGLGKITIGASSQFPNLYDRVVVQLDEGKSLYSWHETLSFLDLDTALHASTEEDLSRIKIGQLFRTIHPREATRFERTDEFFSLSLEELKARIIEQTPDMEDAFDQYLDKMRPQEILPGRMRYSMPGIAEKSRELGARSLISAVTGAYTDDALFNRVGSILKMGMLSTETRYANKINVSGLSPISDFFTGGADSVYTQMITENDCKNKMPLDRLYYHSRVNILVSLDALESGSYQYNDDSFGTRRQEWTYLNRPSLFEFIQNHPYHADGGHEVCLKERVLPQWIQGLVVDDTQTRDKLLNYFRSIDIVQKNDRGEEMILGQTAERFIRIGSHASEELISPIA